jgi:hypothetical protein
MRTHRRLSDAEREQRREQDRPRLHQATEQLLDSDGWQRWVRVRSRNGLARYPALVLRAAVIDRVEWARGRRRHVIDAGPVRT